MDDTLRDTLRRMRLHPGDGAPVAASSETSGPRWFPHLAAAFAYAEAHAGVWKVSFPIEPGTRIQLVREDGQWVRRGLPEEAGLGGLSAATRVVTPPGEPPLPECES